MASLPSGGIQTSTTTNDQEKFIAAKLISRAMIRMVCLSICDKIDQPKGSGKTAYFVRYARMNVPLATITEGTDPANSTFTLETVNVTLDQWGDMLTLTDLVELTTKHPVLNEAINLLADNAQRVIDREVQIVWFTGTNVTYGDGTVTARRSITTAMKMDNTSMHRARITLVDQGAPPKDGPSGGYFVESAGAAKSVAQGQAFVAVCGPQVSGDIMEAGAALGTWAAVATYANAKALYNAEVGTWAGLRIVETNFIPKLRRLGNNTEAVVSTNAFGTDTPVVTAVNGGGALKSATTFFYKVTRKDKTRGFEEFISIAHSTASEAAGDNESFTFNFSSLTAGYVYNLYFDTVTTGGTGTDATMKLVAENVEVGSTVTVTANPTTGATAPDNTGVDGAGNGITVHPVYIHGAESCSWVGLQNLTTMMSIDQATTDNPFKLRRTLSYKYMGKTIIRDQLRMIRLEVASTYA